MLRFKPDVRLAYPHEPLLVPIATACLWSLKMRIDVEVNSIEDGAGVHLAGSLHGSGHAIDFDTVGDKAAETLALAEYLRRALPPGYEVLFEGDHVHVEYDMHRPPLRKAVS